MRLWYALGVLIVFVASIFLVSVIESLPARARTVFQREQNHHCNEQANIDRSERRRPEASLEDPIQSVFNLQACLEGDNYSSSR